ncbi:hypothetical protein K661_02158 [Piscirickettsia salmonis LF-89 = ATCC VR-1361]|nr:hypothetical protein K661_02158 [Piscirickettsia salmonis LF-89 = ATCC VR-1361]
MSYVESSTILLQQYHTLIPRPKNESTGKMLKVIQKQIIT